jgi:hypothetical protein
MKKETYLQKLAATVITDDNTVGEAKVAKRTEAELKRFWRKAALEFVRQNETEAEHLIDNPWIGVDIEFNLKPTGSVTVKLLDLAGHPLPYPPFHQEVERYTVLKRNLFK